MVLYWVFFFGLSLQCLEFLKDIGNVLSIFVLSEKIWEEMLKYL